MTPDTPLLVFWTACLWALARLLHGGRSALVAGGRPVRRTGDGQQIHRRAALVRHRAVAAGHAVGARLAAPAAPWLGALLGAGGVPAGACCGTPATAGRASPGRAAASATGMPASAVRFLGELIGGQIGLVTPLVFVFCVAGIVEAARQAWRTRDPAWTLLAALTVPAVLLFMRARASATGCRATGRRSSIPPPPSPPPACGRRSGAA